MKISFWWLLISFLLSRDGACSSLEYNVWYEKNGTLYDITQTKDSEPVLISISSSGSGGMIVSHESDLPCTHLKGIKFIIDSFVVPYSLNCIVAGDSFFVTYTITDIRMTSYVLKRLRSDFTVILMGNIKLWAGNIKKPHYGTGLWYQ